MTNLRNLVDIKSTTGIVSWYRPDAGLGSIKQNNGHTIKIDFEGLSPITRLILKRGSKVSFRIKVGNEGRAAHNIVVL